MKTKTLFVCQECGTQSPKWLGRCSSCEGWNTFVEENVVKPTSFKRGVTKESSQPVLLEDVQIQEERRLSTQILEFDRVLGGGLVPGSVVLIGGDPGIGKSTLTLQVSGLLGEKGNKVLYVSGEESIKQTKIRSDRLGQNSLSSLFIVNELDLDVILGHIRELNPQVVIIDSIQVVYQPELSSSPGSVTQVRECASILTQLAKSLGFSLFIIGHVTKEGMIAGPRVLEHIVDTVLYFEGERYSTYRVLRATKNRFGSTNEIGVFEMTSQGLSEVSNPSEIFLSERPENVSGSVVVPIIEGTRPFLVEVQGLVSRCSFGMVRYKSQGFDANRLALLIAVLEKKIKLNLSDKDIFLNIVGGVKVIDPAADLGVIIAIASAFLDKMIPFDTVVLGEVGLSSEIRSVSYINQRINEAQKLGFKRCIIPRSNLKARESLKTENIKIVPVETVQQALENF